jgi:dienelactone hydrolase
MSTRPLRVVLLALVVAAAGLAGCSTRHSTHATIEVDAPVALADQAVHVKVSSLHAHERVTISGQATDRDGAVWRSTATFTADERGVVDLDRSAPVTGTYRGADGMGLFWSMGPSTGDPDRSWYLPRLSTPAHTFEVRLTVTAGGRELAARTLTREMTMPGVTLRALQLASDAVAGDLFLPPAGTARHPGVLVLGGSEGGNSGDLEAALLASHGYPALSLAYFKLPGLPATLNDIPLEYFVAAARVLLAQPQAQPAGVVVDGVSRGSEAAMLLADYYPQLVAGTLVYAPNDTVAPGFPERGNAWTNGGAPIPQDALPVTNIAGPVLAIAGDDDEVWPSAIQARNLVARLDKAHPGVTHQLLVYPGAGHYVGDFPYLPAGIEYAAPNSPGPTIKVLAGGGSRPANAAARAAGWPKVLAFLAAIADSGG